MPEQRIYAMINSDELNIHHQFYMCSKFHWDSMDHGDKAIELIDRLRTAGINVDIESPEDEAE